MAGTIIAGQKGRATDFITTSSGATDSGRVPKLNASGVLDNSFMPSGVILPYIAASVPTGWLACDGSAVSRTTFATLFALISTTYGIGNGSTTFNVPDLRGRTIIGSGTGTKVATFASRAGNVITVTGLNNANNNEFQTGQAVLYHTTGSVITGLTNDTTYYVIRNSNLTFTLAVDLASAQNGTTISLSSDGSGTQTFTLTLTARTIGDTGGEETHAMNSSELLAHAHDIQRLSGGGAANGINTNNSNGVISSSGYVNSKGGNAAMNIVQPFSTMNYIIKT